MEIDYIPVLKLKKYQYFITNKTDKSLFFLLGLVAMILYWYSGNQNHCKKTTTYVDVNPIPGLGLVQTCIGQYIEELDHNPPPS